MVNSRATVAIVLFTFIIIISLPITIQNVTGTIRTIVVPNDYPTINSAIAHASAGDTISVKNGIYKENIVINKPISLQGESRESTIIDGNGAGHVVLINADHTIVNQFTIRNSGNVFTDSGLFLNYSESSIISNNLLLSNNIGIYIMQSSNTQLRNNSLSSNNYNFGVFGSSLNGYIQDIDSSNTLDGKPIIYLVNQSNIETPKNAGYVAAIACTSITVSGGNFAKNWQNVLFAYTKNSTVTNITSTLGEDSVWLLESSNCAVVGNNISSNIWGGIALVNSSNCTVKENTFKGNGGYGIFLSDSSNNRFCHNNLIDNARQSWLFGKNANSWDNGYPSGGNYWSKYTQPDAKSGIWQNQTQSDGIVDLPYVIDLNNVDNFPLVKPWNVGSSEITHLPLDFSTVALIVIAVASLIGLGFIVKVRSRRKQESKTSNPKKEG